MVDVTDGDCREACQRGIVIAGSDDRWTLLHVELYTVVCHVQKRQQRHNNYPEP